MSLASRFWRYPETQSAAIRYHHYPSHAGNSELAFIVHLADYAAKEAGFSSEDTASAPEIDPRILDHMGFQKEELSAIALQVAEDVEKLITEFE
jgi:HD-like signal output (HDOD) protein